MLLLWNMEISACYPKMAEWYWCILGHWGLSVQVVNVPKKIHKCFYLWINLMYSSIFVLFICKSVLHLQHYSVNYIFIFLYYTLAHRFFSMCSNNIEMNLSPKDGNKSPSGPSLSSQMSEERGNPPRRAHTYPASPTRLRLKALADVLERLPARSPQRLDLCFHPARWISCQFLGILS